MPAAVKKPLVFFEFGYHYGGSLHSTVLLIEAIRADRDVTVIDAYGACQEYLQALHAAGVPVFILFPNWGGRTTIGGSGPIRRIASLLFSLPQFLRVIVRLRRLISSLHPQAVWVNSEKALFAAWLAVPSRVSLAVYVREDLQNIRWYCAFAWRRANLAIGISKKSLQFLSSTHLSHQNFQVVYNGVDTEATIRESQAQPQGLPGLIPSALRIVLPASLGSPLKGHEIGIRALASWIRAGGNGQLLLCGDVPPGASMDTLARLQQLVRTLEVHKNVFFLGWRRDLLAVIARSDVVILPSFSEGLPRSLLEAMALGKAVIATAVGGVPELVRDGEDGLLIRPGDVEGLSQAFNMLSDKSLREKMGQAARHRVRESFSLTWQAGEFLSAMDRLENPL
jgi:glycosyltransferase involved in cell wall biosynthesis